MQNIAKTINKRGMIQSVNVRLIFKTLSNLTTGGFCISGCRNAY